MGKYETGRAFCTGLKRQGTNEKVQMGTGSNGNRGNGKGEEL